MQAVRSVALDSNAAPTRFVCSWCGQHIEPVGPDKDEQALNYGICDGCLSTQLSRLEVTPQRVTARSVPSRSPSVAAVG